MKKKDKNKNKKKTKTVKKKSVKAAKPVKENKSREYPLNGMQLQFCTEYVKNGMNALQAATIAGYKFPKSQGSRLLTKVRISKYIQKLQQEVADKVTKQISYEIIDAIQDLLTVKDRCMQRVSPLTDKEGNRKFTETEDGGLAAAFTFDATSVIRSVAEIAKLKGMYPAEKRELAIKTVNLVTEQAGTVTGATTK